MRKQKMRFFQKSLCGILSAAMIMTSSMIPDLSVLAAPSAVEGSGSIIDTEGSADRTPSEENTDMIQSPDAGSGDGQVNPDDQNEPGGVFLKGKM